MLQQEVTLSRARTWLSTGRPIFHEETLHRHTDKRIMSLGEEKVEFMATVAHSVAASIRETW